MTENASPDADEDADADADAVIDTGDDTGAANAHDAGDDDASGAIDPIDALETSARPGEEPAATCAYCGRPFASTDAHALHVGDRHATVCTDEERAAADAADERERDDLFYFHLRVVAAIAALYTVVVLLYMIALGSGLL